MRRASCRGPTTRPFGCGTRPGVVATCWRLRAIIHRPTTIYRLYRSVMPSRLLIRSVNQAKSSQFNRRSPDPNPALTAVQMALEMRAAVGTLIEKWRRLGHELGFGIGISHGYATLGTIGFKRRFDYSAIGTVSNIASRLCDEAQLGQILISPRVLVAVEDFVTVEPAGGLTLKGISRPIMVHNVIGSIVTRN
jgi:hypothetical protein